MRQGGFADTDSANLLGFYQIDFSGRIAKFEGEGRSGHPTCRPATNDANRLPLMINSPLKVGSVRAVLTEYNGLKYDLSSQIK